MEEFQFNGERIAFRYVTSEQKSDAELVILVHPLGMSSDVWIGILGKLSEDYNILMIDLPGHGHSLKVTQDHSWSIAQLANMIQSLAEKIGYKKAHYVGTSIGGAIGQELLLSSPEFLISLVATNTSSKIGTFESWTARAKDVRTRGLSVMSEEIVPRWFAPKFIENNPTIFKDWIKKLQVLDNNSYAVLCEALGNWGVSEQLSTRSYKVRVLCVAGELDPAMPLTEMQAFAERIKPEEPLAILPVGHVPSVENSIEFGEVVHAWLTK